MSLESAAGGLETSSKVHSVCKLIIISQPQAVCALTMIYLFELALDECVESKQKIDNEV